MGGAAPLTACISADGSTLLFVRTEYLEYNEVAQTDGKSTYFCILVNEDSHIILFPYSLFCVLCLPRYQSPPLNFFQVWDCLSAASPLGFDSPASSFLLSPDLALRIFSHTP